MSPRTPTPASLDLPPHRAAPVAADLATIEDEVARWEHTPLEERCRRVCAALDTYVIPFDDLVARPVPPGECDRLRLLYLHVPKAAGTTLEMIIAKNYVFKDVIHINSPVLLDNPRAFFKKSELPIAVMGHHQLSDVVYHFLRAPFAHVTLLRDPVERFLSYYGYLRSDPEHPLHARVRDMSIQQFLDSPESIEVRNGQTLRLAGCLHHGALDDSGAGDAYLERAKENLERRFTLIGVTERVDEFLLTARALLGWMDIFHTAANTTSNRMQAASLDGADLSLIRAHAVLDLELYRLAGDLVTQRSEHLGIDTRARREYGARNRQHAALLRGPAEDGGRRGR